MFKTRFRILFAPTLIALLSLPANPVSAQEVPIAPATEAQARELMQVMHSKDNMDVMVAKVKTAMHEGMQQGVRAAIGDQQLTAEQQRQIDGVEEGMTKLLVEEMRWDALEPVMIEVYRRSFSEKEMKSMLEFYKSPEGQAVVAKMPLVMQNSFSLMQEHMQKVIPKITEMQKSTLAHLSDSPKH